MQKSSSSKRKSLKLYALASTMVLALGAAGALFAGVTPATAASLAHQVDTQIAVFMVPLTILMLAILFEVTRVVLRGALPVEAPAPRQIRAYWSPGQLEN
ncbi:hypothetical protein WH87_16465 [Devosia epidermidihirudinis]|uniref:Uncharacterized protein n=1 Tax=Devosia epidermidihirudinis TaxID=1293439 RepID=A0A0F5Q410_9HYPH|nr:hypothetical protein [Devosia epidermidihirudinis]KKC35632.1 hypothetical protein WH87_16465 [Devosia epidermidihirudinis]